MLLRSNLVRSGQALNDHSLWALLFRLMFRLDVNVYNGPHKRFLDSRLQPLADYYRRFRSLFPRA
jgi:hypothetical protein